MKDQNDKEKHNFEVRFAPSFTEDFQRIPEDEREEVWAEVMKAIERISSNPYAGTPIGVNPLVVLRNFVLRTLWNWRLK